MEEGGTNSPPTPFLFSDYIYKMLDNALDIGIVERDFWEMTIAELNRASDSNLRVERLKAKETATHNYVHAVLIGRALAAGFDKNATFPPIHEVYPSLFEDDTAHEEQVQERRDQLSALRFMQFAQSFNKKFNEEEAKNDK